MIEITVEFIAPKVLIRRKGKKKCRKLKRFLREYLFDPKRICIFGRFFGLVRFAPAHHTHDCVARASDGLETKRLRKIATLGSWS